MTATPTTPVASTSIAANRSATRVMPKGAGHPPACRHEYPVPFDAHKERYSHTRLHNRANERHPALEETAAGARSTALLL